MNHYLLRLCVKLHTPIIDKTAEDETPVKLLSYYRNFGVTASSEEIARKLVSQAVSDGDIVWRDYSCKEIDLGTFDKRIAAQCKHPTQQDVWYQSGRVLFPQEDQGNKEEETSH
jgi:hypothetical protein